MHLLLLLQRFVLDSYGVLPLLGPRTYTLPPLTLRVLSAAISAATAIKTIWTAKLPKLTSTISRMRISRVSLLSLGANSQSCSCRRSLRTYIRTHSGSGTSFSMTRVRSPHAKGTEELSR